MDANFNDLMESVSQVNMNVTPEKKPKKKVDESKAPDGTDKEEVIQKKLLEDETSADKAKSIEEEAAPVAEGCDDKLHEMDEEGPSEDPRVKNALLVIMGRAENVKEEQVHSVLKAIADAQDDELMMAAVNSFRMAEPAMEEEPMPEPEPDLEEDPPVDTDEDLPAEEEEEKLD